MKIRIALFLVAWVLYLPGWQSLAKAATLQEEYAQLQSKQKALEATRKQKEDKLAKLTVELKGASERFASCNRARVQVEWDANTKLVEDARRNLEQQNRQLEIKRQEIEKKRLALDERRKQIESSHTNKNPPSEYEADLRDNMSAFQKDYFPNVDRLFDGYEAYFAGAKGYIEFLDKFSGDCNESERSARLVMRDATKKALDIIAEEVRKLQNLWS